MRIAHIGPASLPIGFTHGGAVERRMLELASAQTGRGHQVCTFSIHPVGQEADASRELHSDVGFVDLRCRTARPIRDLELLVRARPGLRAFAPDVVHVHGNWAGAALLKGIEAPKVLSLDFYEYRGSDRSAARALYRRALASFDLLLPVSEHCAAGASQWWGLPPSSFEVLHNGVNGDQFSPDATRRSAARSSLGFADDVVIGYVGRICEQKGSDVLIDAFEIVKGAYPNAALLVAGPTGQFGSSEPSPITARIAAVGGTWLGAVPEESLADVFRAMDIFVMPTRQYEMFGMAAAEALSAGTPVVCSRQGGLPEVVPETAGVLVPPGDPKALADALIRLCVEPSRRRELTDAAHGSASRFSWASIAEESERIYDKVRGR